MRLDPFSLRFFILSVFLFTFTSVIITEFISVNEWQTLNEEKATEIPYIFRKLFGSDVKSSAVPVANEISFTSLSPDMYKRVLIWGTWYDQPWFKRFGRHSPEALREAGCPVWQCNFTSEKSNIDTADAVIFIAEAFGSLKSKDYDRPRSQRWVWVNVEAPQARKPQDDMRDAAVWNPSFLINWTMTYHSNSDIVGFYGYFTVLDSKQMPIVPNKMTQFADTVQKYVSEVSSGITLNDLLGEDWIMTFNKTRIVAWMSSHCRTESRREDYIHELAKYIQVDTYGKCGKASCTHRNPFGNDACWTDTLARYSFYMAMENRFCNEYITEKVYLPMENYIVPVVWGGADYTQFLPPDSYIDARRYHPKDLAQLLTFLHNNPKEYERYHLWRGYWQAHRGGSFCQLCYRLHTDREEKNYEDIGNWRLKNGQCFVAPPNIFAKDGRSQEWQRFLEKYNSTML